MCSIVPTNANHPWPLKNIHGFKYVIHLELQKMYLLPYQLFQMKYDQQLDQYESLHTQDSNYNLLEVLKAHLKLVVGYL